METPEEQALLLFFTQGMSHKARIWPPPPGKELTGFLRWDVIHHLAAITHYYLNQASQGYYTLFKKALPITSLHSSPNTFMNSLPQSRIYNGEESLNCRVGNRHKLAHQDSQELIGSQRAESYPSLQAERLLSFPDQIKEQQALEQLLPIFQCP